jgi:HrpA-like RNA helicase
MHAKSLKDAMHSFVFQRMQEDHPLGRLILVQNNQAAFTFMSPSDIEQAQIEPQKFYQKVKMQERERVVQEMLQAHQMLIITGPTGVGKTHFINQYYPSAHFGEGAIQAWIDDQSQMPMLFIDEANMSFQHNW